MLRKFFAFTLALLLVGTIPLGALAEEYDLVNGSITVEAKEDGQYVSQVGVADNVKQTTETVIKQTDSDTKSTENTITIKADKGQTADVTISDVNIDVSSKGEAAISAEGDGNVTIELEGSNVATSGERHAGVEKSNGGNLTITDADADGSLNAAGGKYGAGIGGGYRQDASNITIEGGTIEAIGGKSAAGIGGGLSGSGSNITIEDGNITASGGFLGMDGGAGIGGGGRGNGSDITINGGTVNANGGGSGAGIGGGSVGSGTNISITDGEVIAKGGAAAAGIGSGCCITASDPYPVGSNISISGGKVEATGGLEGAGIGGGAASSASDITISGDAQVKASSGRYAADIGSGSDGYHNYAPLDPDTSGLNADGSIAYYAPDANMSTDTPEKLLHKAADGTAVTHDGVALKSSTEATCTKNATVTYRCSCGEEVTMELVGTALGHDVASYTYNNDATCMKDGTESGECARCNQSFSRTKAGTRDPNKHNFINYTFNNDATCTQDGTETGKCEYCAKEDVRTAAGTAQGHDIAYTYNNDATCMEDGTETGECARCHQSFTRTKAGTRDPNKHSFSYTPNNDATCTANGTETAQCAYGCGTTDTRDIPGTMLEHDFANYVYQDDATCTADGTEIAQCEHCDATDERTADGTALGHSFTHYVSNNDATYDSDGTQTAECNHGCGATDTIPAPGTRIPLYRVVDAAGRNLPSRESKDGTVLTITAEQDHATLTGTLDGIRTLQQRGITTIVFVTNHATSTFDLASLTGTGSYALTHDGEEVSFTLNDQDVSSILK